MIVMKPCSDHSFSLPAVFELGDDTAFDLARRLLAKLQLATIICMTWEALAQNIAIHSGIMNDMDLVVKLSTSSPL